MDRREGIQTRSTTVNTGQYAETREEERHGVKKLFHKITHPMGSSSRKDKRDKDRREDLSSPSSSPKSGDRVVVERMPDRQVNAGELHRQPVERVVHEHNIVQHAPIEEHRQGVAQVRATQPVRPGERGRVEVQDLGERRERDVVHVQPVQRVTEHARVVDHPVVREDVHITHVKKDSSPIEKAAGEALQGQRATLGQGATLASSRTTTTTTTASTGLSGSTGLRR